jgi:hypothetical protein
MIRPERRGDGSVGSQNIKVVRACVRVLYNDDDEKSVGYRCADIYTIRSVVECVCVCGVVTCKACSISLLLGLVVQVYVLASCLAVYSLQLPEFEYEVF